MFTEDTGIFNKFKSLFGNSEPERTQTATLTRTVVGFEEQASSFADIVDDEPISMSAPVGLRTVEPSAPSVPVNNNPADLDIKFATTFIEQGGKFIYCETIAQAIEELQLLKQENSWTHVFAWENEIKDAFTNFNFQKGAIGYTINNSDAAISLCESLVAEDGSIVFNPTQASRRTLSCFPNTHIVITDVNHLSPSLYDSLSRFNKMHKPELPSVLNISDTNVGHFYDQSRLIMRAEGTKNIVVILVDEKIPVSLKP